MTLARTRINFLAVGVFALVLVGTQKSPASAATPPATPPDVPQAKPSPLLAVMKGELDRSFKTLSTQDPRLTISVTRSRTRNAPRFPAPTARCFPAARNRNRWLEVGVRTGNYDLDNTHKIGERQSQNWRAGNSRADRQ